MDIITVCAVFKLAAFVPFAVAAAVGMVRDWRKVRENTDTTLDRT